MSDSIKCPSCGSINFQKIEFIIDAGTSDHFLLGERQPEKFKFRLFEYLTNERLIPLDTTRLFMCFIIPFIYYVILFMGLFLYIYILFELDVIPDLSLYTGIEEDIIKIGSILAYAFTFGVGLYYLLPFPKYEKLKTKIEEWHNETFVCIICNSEWHELEWDPDA